MKIKLLFTLYSLLFTLFSIYSYSQVDLNLTLSKNPVYLTLQKWMTQLGYFNRLLSTEIFVSLTILLFTYYLLLIIKTYSKKVDFKGLKWWLPVIVFVLICSYPLFSHDIFNYIFNAKMVWLYQTNPHLQVASVFSNDPWLRFMRNVHTPAPYAYGWTVTSLIPGILTLTQNLKLSLWSMKLFIAFFWASQLFILAKIIKKVFPSPRENYRWFLFALNPLVLIETLVVGHNDVVMMFLALVSYYFLLKVKKLFDKNFFFSFLFLGLSISIKYATIVLLPLWLIKGFQNHRVCHSGRSPVPDGTRRLIESRPKAAQFYALLDSIASFTLSAIEVLQNDIGALSAILLFAAIFTRLNQLHSWYLIWAFSFAVLSKNKWIISLFTALTFGALLRYAPHLYFGSWDPQVYILRNLIWGASAILVFPILSLIKHRKQP